jgi:hypothetical protein
LALGLGDIGNGWTRSDAAGNNASIDATGETPSSFTGENSSYELLKALYQLRRDQIIPEMFTPNAEGLIPPKYQMNAIFTC